MLKKIFQKNETYADIKYDKKLRNYYQKYYKQFSSFKDLLNYYKKN